MLHLEPQEKKILLEHIKQGEQTDISIRAFQKYYDCVKLVMDEDKFNPRIVMDALAKSYNERAIKSRQDPEQIFQEYKRKGHFGLLPDEFARLVNEL